MDVPSKTIIFLLPISFLFARFVLYAICRILRRPKNPCFRNSKIMGSGAGLGGQCECQNNVGNNSGPFVRAVARLRQIAIGLVSGGLNPCK